MAAYITRVNYGAAVLAISVSTGFSSSQLAIALTAAFVTYGLGQLVSGFFGDKMQPRTMVAIGLISSACMNFLLPFCASPLQMTAVWSVNGFAQSMLWPPVVRLMASLQTEAEYSRSGIVVGSWAPSLGTVVVYLLVPALIGIRGWKSVFAVCGVMALAVALFWLKMCPVLEPGDAPVRHSGSPADPENGRAADLKFREKKPADTPAPENTSFMSTMFVAIMAAIVMMGTLRDSVTTWMPTFLSETFRLGVAVSILTGVILPVFSIFCTFLASRLYRRLGSNPITCAFFMFAAGTAAAVLLRVFAGNPVVPVFCTVLCVAALVGCMHGVNAMLIAMVPAFYKHTGRVSTVSGILNACTYAGSAVATYLVARLKEAAGWGVTLTFWLAVCAAGTVLCLYCMRKW